MLKRMLASAEGGFAALGGSARFPPLKEGPMVFSGPFVTSYALQTDVKGTYRSSRYKKVTRVSSLNGG